MSVMGLGALEKTETKQEGVKSLWTSHGAQFSNEPSPSTLWFSRSQSLEGQPQAPLPHAGLVGFLWILCLYMQLCVFKKQAVLRKFSYASIYNWTENKDCWSYLARLGHVISFLSPGYPKVRYWLLNFGFNSGIFPKTIFSGRILSLLWMYPHDTDHTGHQLRYWGKVSPPLSADVLITGPPDTQRLSSPLKLVGLVLPWSAERRHTPQQGLYC